MAVANILLDHSCIKYCNLIGPQQVSKSQKVATFKCTCNNNTVNL